MSEDLSAEEFSFRPTQDLVDKIAAAFQGDSQAHASPHRPECVDVDEVTNIRQSHQMPPVSFRSTEFLAELCLKPKKQRIEMTTVKANEAPVTVTGTLYDITDEGPWIAWDAHQKKGKHITLTLYPPSDADVIKLVFLESNFQKPKQRRVSRDSDDDEDEDEEPPRSKKRAESASAPKTKPPPAPRQQIQLAASAQATASSPAASHPPATNQAPPISTSSTLQGKTHPSPPLAPPSQMDSLRQEFFAAHLQMAQFLFGGGGSVPPTIGSGGIVPPAPSISGGLALPGPQVSSGGTVPPAQSISGGFTLPGLQPHSGGITPPVPSTSGGPPPPGLQSNNNSIAPPVFTTTPGQPQQSGATPQWPPTHSGPGVIITPCSSGTLDSASSNLGQVLDSVLEQAYGDTLHKVVVTPGVRVPSQINPEDRCFYPHLYAASNETNDQAAMRWEGDFQRTLKRLNIVFTNQRYHQEMYFQSDMMIALIRAGISVASKEALYPPFKVISQITRFITIARVKSAHLEASEKIGDLFMIEWKKPNSFINWAKFLADATK